jgi:membrane protein implicated in regulation of membrane protease activity
VWWWWGGEWSGAFFFLRLWSLTEKRLAFEVIVFYGFVLVAVSLWVNYLKKLVFPDTHSAWLVEREEGNNVTVCQRGGEVGLVGENGKKSKRNVRRAE